MSYSNNQYSKGRNDQNRFQNGRNGKSGNENRESVFDTIEPVRQPLSREYGSRPEIFLEGQELYKTAKEITSLKTHQVRKVLSVTKEALAAARSGKEFSQARMKLFTLLPMMAYNTGRAPSKEKKSYEKLLGFVYRNVNQESISKPEDIEMFDQMITAVVAYHKFLGGKD